MIKERVLEVSLSEAIGLFDINKWKFWEEDSEEGLVRIEVPRGYTEVYVVELPFGNEVQYKDIADKLSENGFIKQTIRTKGSF